MACFCQSVTRGAAGVTTWLLGGLWEVCILVCTFCGWEVNVCILLWRWLVLNWRSIVYNHSPKQWAGGSNRQCPREENLQGWVGKARADGGDHGRAGDGGGRWRYIMNRARVRVAWGVPTAPRGGTWARIGAIVWTILKDSRVHTIDKRNTK